MKSITSPVGTGSDTTTTTYSYSASGNLTTLSTTVNNSTTQQLSYIYDNDRLVGIVTPNGEYEIEYDIWGQVKCVYLVTETKTPLVSYTYNSGVNRTQVKTITYNQDVYSYVYNEDGEVINIKLNGKDKHIITYDNLGNLSTIKNTDGRMVLYSDKGTSIYTPSTQNESGYSLIYQSIINDDGEYIEENYGVTYKDAESEYDYDSNTGSSTSTTGIEINDTYRITQTNKTDWFGRATSDSVSLYNITNEVVDDEGNVVTPAQTLSRIETEYSYPVASDGKTTTRLEKFINKTYNGNSTSATVFDGISYEYDKQNRIVAEKTLTSSGSKTEKYSYEYDKLGQLVRFNDAVANKSYTYSYDANGNMLSKKTYNYTIGQLGTATGTISYAYDSQWKDKLASYNGQSITYDSIGNPINYMGATLTWEGRNLKSYTKDSVSINYEYDENGLRYKKTLKDSSDNYELTENYIWNDGKLISIVISNTDGVNMTYKYLYNESDEPVGYIMFEADGSIFANCYYLKNMQGDITGIVNSSGSVLIRYYYDAFGKRTTDYCADDLLDRIVRMMYSLGNPFGYRGYCYDGDTGLYYLQSRYYDPNTGRFINADDTNYLNATGTVLGCNLFAYCENDPVNYSDSFGNFSVKKANEVLMNLLSNIKGAFYDYIFSLIKNEKGEPAIHTDIIAVVINSVIKALLTRALISTANSVLTIASKTYLQTHTGDAINIIKKIINFLTQNQIGKKIIKKIAKIILSALGIKSGALNTLLSGIISNLIKIKSNLIKKIAIVLTAFSSIGNFLAFIMFDIVDKNIDSYLSFKAIRRMTL